MDGLYLELAPSGSRLWRLKSATSAPGHAHRLMQRLEADVIPFIGARAIGSLDAPTILTMLPATRGPHLDFLMPDRCMAKYDDKAIKARYPDRKTRARAHDALIASVAISQDLPLYTADADVFQGISGLDLAEVAVPDEP